VRAIVGVVMHENEPKGGMSEQRYNYVAEYRNTGMGGITRPIAVCARCGIIRAHALRLSRRGTHGEAFYLHEHPLVFLVLKQSNTGKRSYYIEGEPDEELRGLLEEVGRAWLRHMEHTSSLLSVAFRCGV
jgi:hypothetical protein